MFMQNPINKIKISVGEKLKKQTKKQANKHLGVSVDSKTVTAGKIHLNFLKDCNLAHTHKHIYHHRPVAR